MSEASKASSWSLRVHYSDDLDARPHRAGLQGTALCNPNIRVYTDLALRSYYFTQKRLDRERPMCKRCEAAFG